MTAPEDTTLTGGTALRRGWQLARYSWQLDRMSHAIGSDAREDAQYQLVRLAEAEGPRVKRWLLRFTIGWRASAELYP